MYLHRSNRAEALVEILSAVVSERLGSPLSSECIVVQGKGMERWLSMQLARRHGIWANPDFPFARTVIDRAFAALLGKSAGKSWDAKTMTWAIAQALRERSGEAGFDEVARYLVGDVEHAKLLQLAARTASVFDGYAVYRPELLLAWSRGNFTAGDGQWQGRLWQGLCAEHDFRHPGAVEADFMEALQSGSGPIAGFPARLSLFGISALPPLYLRVFAALAERIPVHNFVLSPSQEYWADIQSQRQILKAELSGEAIDNLEIGHPLLASLGSLHRDYQLLLERDISYRDATESYIDAGPAGDSMLGTLQDDILHLRSGEVQTISEGDRSIQVHSCHGPMRELEVLRDQLTALLEADEALAPSDIIVMCPDVDSYAPAIDAVFEAADGDRHTLPFHIADRPPRSTLALVDAFARLLDLVPTRLTAPAVLDLLSIEVIRERFGIAADDLPKIHHWISESKIRWAVDAEHRHEVGQPHTLLNTWRFGLQRLLLGYASPGEDSALFADVLPYDDIEGTEAELLGRFADFCEELFALCKACQGARSAAAWQPVFESALDSMLAAGDDLAPQHQFLRESFAELATAAQDAHFDAELSLRTLLPLLEERWDALGTRSNFMSGGITFCQLMPMRSVPHKVVCIIGMNDGAFPRQGRPTSFDLIAASPRLGDRRARDDDRFLFLEAILSARQTLYISYTGQSESEGHSLPPSVVVGELLDELEARFRLPEGSKTGSGDGAGATGLREHLTIKHPLQGFSPRYFSGADDRLFSYSQIYCQGAKSLLSEAPRGRRSFLREAFAADTEPVVELRDLLSFYRNPAQHFVNQRVGIYLRRDRDALEGREPLDLGGLERWKIGDALLRAMLEGEDPQSTMRALRASGALPLGTPGQVHLELELPIIDAIVTRARQNESGGALPKLEIDSRLGEFHLVGQLGSLFERCRHEVSFSSVAGKRELLAWIQHLVLCHETPDGYPRTSISVGRDGSKATAVRFRPVADPAPLLHELIEIYQLGQRTPLPLFTAASRCYTETLLKDKAQNEDASDDNARWKAHWAYIGSDYDKSAPPDREDIYNRQLFGFGDPLSDEYTPFDEAPEGYRRFYELAMSVYAPMLDHREALS